MRWIVLASAAAVMACSGEPADGPAETGDQAGDISVIEGRWGIMPAACDNEQGMADGLITITPDEIHMGLDICAIAEAEPLGEGGWLIYGECNGAEGDAYAREFEFARTDAGRLRFNNTPFDRVETYVACEERSL